MIFLSFINKKEEIDHLNVTSQSKEAVCIDNISRVNNNPLQQSHNTKACTGSVCFISLELFCKHSWKRFCSLNCHKTSHDKKNTKVHLHQQARDVTVMQMRIHALLLFAESLWLVHQVPAWKDNEVQNVPTCSLLQRSPFSHTQICSSSQRTSFKKSQVIQSKQMKHGVEQLQCSSPSPSRAAWFILTTAGAATHKGALKVATVWNEVHTDFWKNKYLHENSSHERDSYLYMLLQSAAGSWAHPDMSQLLPSEIPFCPPAHCRQHQAFWKQYEIQCAALQQQHKLVMWTKNIWMYKPLSTKSLTLAETYWSGWSAGTDTRCRISNLWKIKYTQWQWEIMIEHRNVHIWCLGHTDYRLWCNVSGLVTG